MPLLRVPQIRLHPRAYGLLTLLLLCGPLFAPCSLSQDGPRPPGSGRSAPEHSFWQVMRDVHRQVFSSRLDFMVLLGHPDIRAEVGIDEEEYQRLLELNVQLFEEIKAFRKDEANAQLDHQQLVAKVGELMKQHDLEFNEQLQKVTDYDRFIEILVQARGNRSVVHEEVARRIGLPPDKLDELRAVSHSAWREQMEGMEDKIRELIRRGEIQEMAKRGQNREVRQLFERAERKVNEAVGMRLTSHQLDALKQLRGEAFQLPENLFEIRLPHLSNRRGPRGNDDSQDRHQLRP